MKRFEEAEAQALEAIQSALDARYAALQAAVSMFDERVAALWNEIVVPAADAYNAARTDMLDALTSWEDHFAEIWAALGESDQLGAAGELAAAYEQGFGAAAEGYRDALELTPPDVTDLDDKPESFRKLMEDGF